MHKCQYDSKLSRSFISRYLGSPKRYSTVSPRNLKQAGGPMEFNLADNDCIKDNKISSHLTISSPTLLHKTDDISFSVLFWNFRINLKAMLLVIL